MSRKLKYRVEFNAEQQNYHQQVLDANGQTIYPEGTEGWVTLLQSATDAEFNRFKKFVAVNRTMVRKTEYAMLYISRLYLDALPKVKRIRIGIINYYCIKIDRTNYLVIDKNGVSLNYKKGEAYELGELINDWNNNLLFSDDSEYDINQSPLSGMYLFESWLDSIILNKTKK